MAQTPPPQYGPTIYIDGGTKWFKENSDAQFCLGDGDSQQDGSSKNLDLQFPSEKDASDTELAFNLLPQQPLKIWAWGFLGGEKAHELSNFGTAHRWLEGRFDSAVLFDQEILFLSPGQWELSLKHEFSLLSLEPNQIRLEGDCQYQLKQPTPITAFSSLGLSNKAWGTINVQCAHALMVLGRPSLSEKILYEIRCHTVHP